MYSVTLIIRSDNDETITVKRATVDDILSGLYHSNVYHGQSLNKLSMFWFIYFVFAGSIYLECSVIVFTTLDVLISVT